MHLKQLLFPETSRTFFAKRWLDISLRTLHLIGIMGIAGGVLFAAPEGLWLPYAKLTILSGVAMVVLSVWSNGIWLIQLRGLMIIVKLMLLTFVSLDQNNSLVILIIIVIISGIISHAPAKIRYYSPISRKY